MKIIKLSNGMECKVDDADYDELHEYRWHAAVGKTSTYAFRDICQPGKKRTVLMHRQIMNYPLGKKIDHRDHDGLNNQRNNLRLATSLENQRNQRKRRGTSSIYKGVGWDSGKGNWKAQIKLNGRSIRLGAFKTEIEGAIAYDAAAARLFGEFAVLNFPSSHPTPCESV